MEGGRCGGMWRRKLHGRGGSRGGDIKDSWYKWWRQIKRVQWQKNPRDEGFLRGPLLCWFMCLLPFSHIPLSFVLVICVYFHPVILSPCSSYCCVCFAWRSELVFCYYLIECNNISPVVGRSSQNKIFWCQKLTFFLQNIEFYSARPLYVNRLNERSIFMKKIQNINFFSV